MIIRLGRLLTAGLLAISLVWTVPFAFTAFVFGFPSVAQLFFLLYLTAVAFLWWIADRYEVPCFFMRLNALLVLPTLLRMALEFELIPPFLPYTPIRNLALWGAILLPVLLPPLFLVVGFMTEIRRSLLLVPTGLLLATVLLGDATLRLRSLFIIPPEFSGSVTIELADITCPRPPVQNGFRRFTIPDSGKLCAFTPHLDELAWCASSTCRHPAYFDRWVRAGAESIPLKTGGEHRQIVEIRLGPSSQTGTRLSSLLSFQVTKTGNNE